MENGPASQAASSDISRTATPRNQTETGCDTMFVGGLDGFKNKHEAEKWLADQMWWSYAPEPKDWYIKGDDFKGKLFAKFGSPAEAGTALQKVQKLNLKYEDKVIFAKIDLPLEVRLTKSQLFLAKDALVGHGFDKQGLWVDTNTNTLNCGKDIVLAANVNKGQLCPSFEPGLDEHGLSCSDYIGKEQVFAKGLADANEKLAKNKAPSKGLGKGRGKGDRNM